MREFDRLYPSVERPLVRLHPVTGKMALLGDASAVSHIVGMTRDQTRAVFERITRLCEVPEYQLRLGWQSEGDVIIHDNYATMHRVVADFYHIPLESRLVENIGTLGFPQGHNVVLAPGSVEIDDSHNQHHEVQKQDRSLWNSSRLFSKNEESQAKVKTATKASGTSGGDQKGQQAEKFAGSNSNSRL